jgi:putative oxidoreductase
MSKGKTIALWVVSCLVSALFLFAGGAKLLTPAQTRAAFATFGYPAWFATFIGVCELLGGLGLLIPRLAALAAACLSIIMVGAVYTVTSHHQYSQMPMPVAVFALLVCVCVLRIKAPRAAAQVRAVSQGN